MLVGAGLQPDAALGLALSEIEPFERPRAGAGQPPPDQTRAGIILDGEFGHLPAAPVPSLHVIRSCDAASDTRLVPRQCPPENTNVRNGISAT